MHYQHGMGQPVLRTAGGTHRRLHGHTCFFQQTWQQGDDIQQASNQRKRRKDTEEQGRAEQTSTYRPELTAPLLKQKQDILVQRGTLGKAELRLLGLYIWLCSWTHELRKGCKDYNLKYYLQV